MAEHEYGLACVNAMGELTRLSDHLRVTRRRGLGLARGWKAREAGQYEAVRSMARERGLAQHQEAQMRQERDQARAEAAAWQRAFEDCSGPFTDERNRAVDAAKAERDALRAENARLRAVVAGLYQTHHTLSGVTDERTVPPRPCPWREQARAALTGEA